MREILFVGAGGFLGAVLRYGVAVAFGTTPFPYATFLVNVVGSFGLGVTAALLERGAIPDLHRQFFAIGLFGALTTFSTFSLETLGLMKNGAHGAAALSVGLNVGLALVAARVGWGVAS